MISIYQLLFQLNCLEICIISNFYLHGPSLKRPLEVAKATNGLYFLHLDAATPSSMSVSSTAYNAYDVTASSCPVFTNQSCNVSTSAPNPVTLLPLTPHCNSSSNNNKTDMF